MNSVSKTWRNQLLGQSKSLQDRTSCMVMFIELRLVSEEIGGIHRVIQVLPNSIAVAPEPEQFQCKA